MRIGDTKDLAQTLAPSCTHSARMNAISWPTPSSATSRAADEGPIRGVGTPDQRNVGSTIGREEIRLSNLAGTAPATITRMAATVFLVETAKWDLRPGDRKANVNFFSRVTVDSTVESVLNATDSTAADYIERRAEMAVLAGA